jgi:hypothetical protein
MQSRPRERGAFYNFIILNFSLICTHYSQRWFLTSVIAANLVIIIAPYLHINIMVEMTFALISDNKVCVSASKLEMMLWPITRFILEHFYRLLMCRTVMISKVCANNPFEFFEIGSNGSSYGKFDRLNKIVKLNKLAQRVRVRLVTSRHKFLEFSWTFFLNLDFKLAIAPTICELKIIFEVLKVVRCVLHFLESKIIFSAVFIKFSGFLFKPNASF